MRQSVLSFLSIVFVAAIAGCGGSGGLKNSAGTLTTPALVSGGSSTGGSSSSAGSTTGSASSTPGASSSSGSAAAGTGTAGSVTAGTGTGSSTPESTSTPSSATAVVITSPTEGATVASPAQIAAAVTGSAAISSVQLYVDNGVAFQDSAPQISAALQLPAGAHTLVAQAWDQNGTPYKSAPVHIMVQESAAPSEPAPAPAPPSPPQPTAPAATIGQIQIQGGWDNCDVCAGQGGNGPSTSHAMVQGISSPSLSGAAARFDLGGTPWGAALWWHELGSHDDAQNLRYDLDFYIDSTSSAQALEFDVNQTVGGSKYIFGTECDFRGSGAWRVWNGPAHTWSSTGVGCPVPQTNTWHHVRWEFQRSGGQAHFIAVTLDGNRQDVGQSFDGIGASGSGLDVAFQADLNAAGGSESVWLDNVGLSW